MQKIDSTSGEAYIDETCGTFGFKAPELKKGAYITPKVIKILIVWRDIFRSSGVLEKSSKMFFC